MSGSRVVIALGSNLGDRLATLHAATEQLAGTPGVRVTAVSSPVESAAVKLDGVDESAPAYLNAVALIETDLDPRQLLDALHGIERGLGRVRLQRWGDRTIDLDIVDFAGRELATPELELPHPRAWERPFVVQPWLEVDPEAVLPGHGRVADLAAAASTEVRPVGSPAVVRPPSLVSPVVPEDQR